MKSKPNKKLPPQTQTNKDFGKKLKDLKNKLKELAVKKPVKKSKKDPTLGQIFKLRRHLIQASEVFENDKDKVPLEILSLTKRLVFSINQFEEQQAMERDAATADDGDPPVEVVF